MIPKKGKKKKLFSASFVLHLVDLFHSHIGDLAFYKGMLKREKRERKDGDSGLDWIGLSLVGGFFGLVWFRRSRSEANLKGSPLPVRELPSPTPYASVGRSVSVRQFWVSNSVCAFSSWGGFSYLGLLHFGILCVYVCAFVLL